MAGMQGLDSSQISPVTIPPGTAPTPVASLEVGYRETIYRMTLWDDSVAFLAKPVKVRTRKGKDYFVVRVTIPKDVCEKLAAREDDFLHVRARVAPWYLMVNWGEYPEAWRGLPVELKVLVAQSGLPLPAELREALPPGPGSNAAASKGPELVYLPSPPVNSPQP